MKASAEQQQLCAQPDRNAILQRESSVAAAGFGGICGGAGETDPCLGSAVRRGRRRLARPHTAAGIEQWSPPAGHQGELPIVQYVHQAPAPV